VFIYWILLPFIRLGSAAAFQAWVRPYCSSVCCRTFPCLSTCGEQSFYCSLRENSGGFSTLSVFHPLWKIRFTWKSTFIAWISF